MCVSGISVYIQFRCLCVRVCMYVCIYFSMYVPFSFLYKHIYLYYICIALNYIFLGSPLEFMICCRHSRRRCKQLLQTHSVEWPKPRYTEQEASLHFRDILARPYAYQDALWLPEALPTTVAFKYLLEAGTSFQQCWGRGLFS